jgi:type IV pilus assembly protein PilV
MKPIHTTRTPLQRLSQGFALIETMVAVFVLALGLLGMASLQIKTMKATRSSEARSQAVMLSYYILDAMRADKQAAIAGRYNSSGMLCSANALGTSTLADNTRRHWLTNLQNNMGAATSACGSINCDNTGFCRVEIRWDDSPAGGAGQQTFATGSRL